MPARLRLQTSVGTIVLDFCEARIVHPVVEIDVDDVVSGMGTITSKVPSRPRPGAAHLVVRLRF